MIGQGTIPVFVKAEAIYFGRKKARREPGLFACLVLQVAAATWLPFSQWPSLLLLSSRVLSSQLPSWQLPSSPEPSWQLLSSCCLLGWGLLCCFLNGQLFTSFGDFAGALAYRGLLGLGLSALRASTALLAGGFLCGLLWPQSFSLLLFFAGAFLTGAFMANFLRGRLFLRGLLPGRLRLGFVHDYDHRLFSHSSSSSEEVSTLEVSTSSSSSKSS